MEKDPKAIKNPHNLKQLFYHCSMSELSALSPWQAGSSSSQVNTYFIYLALLHLTLHPVCWVHPLHRAPRSKAWAEGGGAAFHKPKNRKFDDIVQWADVSREWYKRVNNFLAAADKWAGTTGILWCLVCFAWKLLFQWNRERSLAEASWSCSLEI